MPFFVVTYLTCGKVRGVKWGMRKGSLGVNVKKVIIGIMMLTMLEGIASKRSCYGAMINMDNLLGDDGMEDSEDGWSDDFYNNWDEDSENTWNEESDDNWNEDSEDDWSDDSYDEYDWNDVEEDEQQSSFTADDYYNYEDNSDSNEYESDEYYENLLSDADTDSDGFVTNGTILLAYEGKEKNITVPNHITRIYGFHNDSIQSITIPASVEELRNSIHCSNLKTVKFKKRDGKSLVIGNNCFKNMYSLKSITLPKETVDIGCSCFTELSDRINITVPDGITKIKDGCFNTDSSISVTKGEPTNPSVFRVILPDSVTEIEDSVFCDGFRIYVKVPNSLKKIGKNSLTNIAIVECEKGSYIEKYCKKNYIKYYYNDTKPLLKHKTLYIVKGYQEDIMFEDMGLGNVSFSVEDSSIVKVTESYDLKLFAKAKKEGKTKLTITVNKKKYVCNIVVLSVSKENRIKQIISNYTTSEMSNYEKAASLLDWMMSNVNYDWTYINEGKFATKYSSLTAEGALLGKRAICSGYARAYKELMDEVGIKCMIIEGTFLPTNLSHAWNLVKIGKQWTHIDATMYSGFESDSDVNMKTNYKWDHSKYPKATLSKSDWYYVIN